MRVKVFVTIDIDPEEYPVPADGDVAVEIEDSIQEYFYDNLEKNSVLFDWVFGDPSFVIRWL